MTVNLEKPGDTFLDLRCWGKGVVWVNGHCLCRFWDIGPTQTAYLPGCWLHAGKNEIIILDYTGPEHPIIRAGEADSQRIASRKGFCQIASPAGEIESCFRHAGSQRLICSWQRHAGNQIRRAGHGEIFLHRITECPGRQTLRRHRGTDLLAPTATRSAMTAGRLPMWTAKNAPAKTARRKMRLTGRRRISGTRNGRTPRQFIRTG